MSPYKQLTRRATAWFALALASSAFAADLPNRATTAFRYELVGDVATDTVSRVSTTLDAHHAAIFSHLGVTGPSLVSVKIWRSANAFEADTRADSVATEIAGIDGSIQVVSQGATIRLLDRGDETAANALHELTHLASIGLNPLAARAPRWLWESIALFEAGQFVPPSQSSCVTLTEIPTLDRLAAPSTPSTVIYHVGFLLAEFIVEEFGQDALRHLLTTGGDLEAALKTRPVEFEGAWHQYVANRYLRTTVLAPTLSSDQVNEEISGNTFYFEDGRSLYFAADRRMILSIGDASQSGRWFTTSGEICWQVLNFEEFCAVFRKSSNLFLLDTPSDCGRYPLRRAAGGPH